jgi:hypothetical protein
MFLRSLKLLGSILILVVIAACGFGCYSAQEDDGLRTVPVTNNPRIIPNSGGGPLSGFGY